MSSAESEPEIALARATPRVLCNLRGEGNQLSKTAHLAEVETVARHMACVCLLHVPRAVAPQVLRYGRTVILLNVEVKVSSFQ